MSNVTFFISIISFFMSLNVYINNKLSARFKVGIKHEQNMVDDEESSSLFIKISFINHSSKPLTILDVKILNENKKPFDDHATYKYGVEVGCSIPINLQVKHSFLNEPVKEYQYRSKTFPETIPPYQNTSNYYGFYFERQDAHINSKSNTLFFLVQTTEGTFYYEAHPGSFFYELNKQTNQYELHPFKFFGKKDCLKSPLFNNSYKIQKRKNNSNSRNNKSKK